MCFVVRPLDPPPVDILSAKNVCVVGVGSVDVAGRARRPRLVVFAYRLGARFAANGLTYVAHTVAKQPRAVERPVARAEITAAHKQGDKRARRAASDGSR